jgi:hypothetical protein
VIGCQTPRLAHFPTFFTTLADDVVDLSMVAGIDLLPWEELILRNSLGVREDSKWSASQVLVIACRQNGKNIICEARELGGLFLLGEKKILHTAHEFKTSKDAFVSLSGRIDAVPDLQELCKLPHRTSNEEVSIRTVDGGFCRYIARNKNSGRGFHEVDLVICDEAYELDDDTLAALKPTQGAAKNPQMWFMSSAGTGNSQVLSRVRSNGISGRTARLLFGEWSAEEGSALHDRAQWALANPSLGHFVDLEFLDEQYDILGPLQFGREHMGLWDDPQIRNVVPPESWKACEDAGSVIVSSIAVGVSVTPDRLRASLAVAGRTAQGLVQVEVIESERGTGWIAGRVAALLASSQPPIAVCVDATGASASLIPALNELDVEVHALSTRDVVQACGSFYDKAMDGSMRHRGDTTLAVALGGASKRFVGTDGGWVWDQRDSSTDLSGLKACTNAMHTLAVKSVLAGGKSERSGKVWC